MKSKRNSKLKAVALGVTAVATSFIIGMSAGCTKTVIPEVDDEKVTTKEDLQDIKNGNFEFFNNKDGLYPISTPDSWNFGHNGTNSTSMSGIIDTSKKGWEYLTDRELPKTLEENDDLSASDENKKDYNGALTDDMLYKDMHTATKKDASDEDKVYIENPNTHNLKWDSANNKYVYVNESGTQSDVYTKQEDDGKIYSDAECTKEIGTNVLMIHNYRKDYYRGTEGYYESTTTLSLEANTACKISLWVKTAELYSDDSSGKRSPVTFNKGAYIDVNTEVGGNSLDTFTIKNINTEQVNKENANNGWVQYTVYVEASSFATTNVTLTLGLGENGVKGINTVEGYAFFDDISFERYKNVSALKEANTDFNEVIRDADTTDLPANTYYPLATDAKNEFRVDVPKYETQDGPKTEKNNSTDRNFFIDFASTTASNQTITFSASNTNAGLTVDKDDYSSSKGSFNNPDSLPALADSPANVKLPNNLKDGLDVTNDFVSIEDTNSADWTFSLADNPYANKLNESLKFANTLPGANANSNTLVMLSSWGAGYEAVISDSKFTVDNGEHKLISFWVKTSDFNGKTPATITVSEVTENKEEAISSNFTIDSTTQTTTDFGEEKDIYNGWVRCFIRVDNTAEDGVKTFNIKVNLGRTSFKGTSATDYFNQSGWVALTNISVLTLDEAIYDYTSGLPHTSTISFTEKTASYSANFDSEQGDKNEIETDLAIPSKYTGANGASINVAPTGQPYSEYDGTNSNDFAGLLNRDNLENYKDKAWYSALGLSQDAPVADVWKNFAGDYSVQPLLIVNSVRTFSEISPDAKVYNYGYIGNSATVSANSYAKISVRVKASAGAIANVYLTDPNSDNNQIYAYKLPEFNFYYDDDGNLLKSAYDEDASEADKKANIAYTLRDDGLYENGDGKLYANFYNLTKYYDYKYENQTYYTSNGEKVSFNKLVTGETYYADKECTKYAPHYLIAGGKQNNKVYEYVDGLGDSATYYYVEKGVANTAKLVHGVDKSLRRETSPSSDPYHFVIDTVANPELADKWINVTFYVRTGSAEKNYQLELWSGERDKQTTENVVANSYVLFDYSAESQSVLDETSFNNSVAEYTNAIIADLKEKINEELSDNNLNISELEKLVASDYVKLYDYKNTYYTFSLYDSPDFIPFNAGTAKDGETGYSYKYSDYEEALSFLKVTDNDNANFSKMNAFIDYSVIDKDIEILGEPELPTPEETPTETNPASQTNVGLLAASIVLTVAIFIAILAMLIKGLISKRGKKKTHVSKNNYNFTKNKRYVKKYVKANGEAPVANDGVDGDTTNGQPVGEQPTTSENSEEQTDANQESQENGESAEQSNDGNDGKTE